MPTPRLAPLAALLALLLASFVGAGAARAEVAFKVSVPANGSLGAGPWSGRLVVIVVRDDAMLPPDFDPLDGPSWDDPQPIFGVDVQSLRPGASVMVGGAADFFPTPVAQLRPGSYRAAARLHAARTRSDWRKETGNLYSATVKFQIKEGQPGQQVIEIDLTEKTAAPAPPVPPGVEMVEVRSRLLSDFRGSDVALRAAVVLPIDYDSASKREYAAVYEVPGFGGDHTEGFREGRARAAGRRAWPGSPEHALWSSAFKIVLDPESPNGHTLFADSANNGPCGRALVEELIPAIEARFPLAKSVAARILRGHSSGGWSTLWLAITYPDTFGACWSSSPDPVDFRRFQQTDIYSRPSMFTLPGPGGKQVETTSFRRAGKELMTVRQEVGGERLTGPDNTSGAQWASWQAVWGPRNANGHPAALFDPVTGAIDPAVAEQYRKFDIAEIVRASASHAATDPHAAARLFRERIRIVVGDADNFYLNEAVALLREVLAATAKDPDGPVPATPQAGYIKIVPGLDHSTIFGSKEIRAIPEEMAAHLRASGLLAEPATKP